MIKFKGQEWVIYFIFISILLTDCSILFKIPIIQQIFVFIFLTFLPGFLIIRILKIDQLELIETFILSEGLSIAFLYFFGLVQNTIFLVLHFNQPLSLMNLLIPLNITLVLLAISGYYLNKNTLIKFPKIQLSRSEKMFLIIPIFFPALCIFGMYLLNTTGNNIITLVLILLIPIYIFFMFLFTKEFPKRLYPIIIFLISISLILLLALRSNYLIGADTHAEYYLFSNTIENLSWGVLKGDLLSACLSVSLLPTIFSQFLNINNEILFKILYPLLFSITPLIIFVIAKKYIDESYAFLAACFYMFQLNFLITTTNARTYIAILFVALALMVIINNNLKPLQKKILIIIFIISCVLSHYSTTYLFFIIMILSFIGICLLNLKTKEKTTLSIQIIFITFVMIIFWYTIVTQLLDYSVYFILDKQGIVQNILNNQLVESFVKVEGDYQGPLITIPTIFRYLLYGLLSLGILTTVLLKYQEKFSKTNFFNLNFLKGNFDDNYFGFIVVSTIFLFLSLFISIIFRGYGAGRVMTLILLFLSIFTVIGFIVFIKLFYGIYIMVKNNSYKISYLIESFIRFDEKIFKKEILILMLVLIIPQYFDVTGVMHQMSGYSASIILNPPQEGQINNYGNFYVRDQEDLAFKWFKIYHEDYTINADMMNSGKILSRTGLFSKSISLKFLNDNKIDHHNEYIIYGYANIYYDKMIVIGTSASQQTLFKNIKNLNNDEQQIFQNGGTNIYMVK